MKAINTAPKKINISFFILVLLRVIKKLVFRARDSSFGVIQRRNKNNMRLLQIITIKVKIYIALIGFIQNSG
jgi:hypothetical protein